MRFSLTMPDGSSQWFDLESAPLDILREYKAQVNIDLAILAIKKSNLTIRLEKLNHEITRRLEQESP